MPQRGPKATRVCWVSSARYSQPLNATEAQKWRLLAGLGGYDLRVIGFSDSIMPRRYQQGARFYLLPQLPGAPLRYLTFFALTPWLLLILMLRAGDSILVAQSPYEGAAAAWVKNVLGLLGRGPRLIIENHNNFEEDLFLQRRVRFQGLYRALMLGLARYAFGRGDALRVISSSTSERARHYAPGLPQARFMAFSDMRAFQGVRRAVPVERAQDIVYAGVLIPRKGVDLLLEAFARLNHPRARLHVIGEAANADYARSLRERAQKLGIADRVHFAGALPQASLAEYFRVGAGHGAAVAVRGLGSRHRGSDADGHAGHRQSRRRHPGFGAAWRKWLALRTRGRGRAH